MSTMTKSAVVPTTETEDLYELLGVARDAKTSEIKAAWRRIAGKLHPDKGGSEEAFKRARNAYTILSNPRTRALYDAQGVQLTLEEIERQAENVLSDLIQQAVDRLAKADISPYHDFAGEMKQQVTSAIRDTEEIVEELKQAKNRLEKNAKRMRHKSAGAGKVFNAALDEKKKKIDADMVNRLKVATVLSEVAKLVEEFSFDFDEKPKTRGTVEMHDFDFEAIFGKSQTKYRRS